MQSTLSAAGNAGLGVIALAMAKDQFAHAWEVAGCRWSTSPGIYNIALGSCEKQGEGGVGRASDTRSGAECEAELRSSDQTGSVVTRTIAIARTVDPIRPAGVLEFRGAGPSKTGTEVKVLCSLTNDGPCSWRMFPKLQGRLWGRGDSWFGSIAKDRGTVLTQQVWVSPHPRSRVCPPWAVLLAPQTTPGV